VEPKKKTREEISKNKKKPVGTQKKIPKTGYTFTTDWEHDKEPGTIENRVEGSNLPTVMGLQKLKGHTMVHRRENFSRGWNVSKQAGPPTYTQTSKRGACGKGGDQMLEDRKIPLSSRLKGKNLGQTHGHANQTERIRRN